MLSLCGSQQPLALFLPPIGLLSQPHMALTHLKSSQAVRKGNSSEGVVCRRPQELHEEELPECRENQCKKTTHRVSNVLFKKVVVGRKALTLPSRKIDYLFVKYNHMRQCP